MYKQHTCSRENCPRKNWPTQQKDMDLALQVLFDIVRSSTHKYADYDTDKAVATELMSDWVAKLFIVMPEHYDSKEKQHEILFNILLTLVEIYPKDGLPRKALNELIASEQKRLLEEKDVQSTVCNEQSKVEIELDLS